MENKNHDLVFWLLALSTLVLGIVVIGNLSKKPVQVNNDSAAVAEVARLKTELQTRTNQPTQAESTSDHKGFLHRIKITEEQKNTPIAKLCGTQNATNEPANQTVRYIDVETGTAFEAPYNTSWGYEFCALDVVDRLDNALVFGSPGATFRDANRDYSLTISKSISENDLETTAIDGVLMATGKLTKQVINGLPVFDYETAGDVKGSEAHHWDVIGKNYLYRLTVIMADKTLAEATNEATKIIKSIQVLK